MKQNVAASAASPKRRSRNMKPARQPKTAVPEPLKGRSCAEPFAGSITRLFCLLEAALGTDTPAVGTAVGTPLGTLVSKIQSEIQSSDCSAFAAVETPSVIPGSEVSDVAGASTPLLQQNVKLHPVLGFFVPTRRRASRFPCPCPCSRVPQLLSLFPGGNCDN